MLNIIQNIINFATDFNQNFADFAMVVITLVSVAIAFFSFQHSKKRKKVAKAVELVKYYQENILTESAYIEIALENSEFQNISKKCFVYNEIENFNLEELERLLKKYDKKISVDDVTTKFNNIDAENIIKASYTLENKCFGDMMYNAKIIFDENAEQVRKDAAKFNVHLELTTRVSDLLNTLEWFSMNFTSGIADPETVYQSLHQTFLAIVQQLYFFLSFKNTEQHSKYYTNIISLYILWSEKERKVKAKEKAISEKANKKQSKLTKIQKRV